MKKIIALALALIMILSMGVVAFAADVMPTADANGVITLTEDVTLSSTYTVEAGETVTIDLNGFTISGTNVGSGLIHVENGAVLNIRDNSEGKTGIIEADGTGLSTIWVEGECNLYAGTISMQGTDGIRYSVEVNPDAWDAAYTAPTVFNMYGGSLVSNKDAIRVVSYSYHGYTDISAEFNMYGGNIDAVRDAIFVQQPNDCYDTLKVTINDGVIESERAIRYYTAAYASSVTGSVQPTSIEINGGDIEGEIVFAVADSADKDTLDMKISGGTFSVAPPAEYVTDDADITVIPSTNTDGAQWFPGEKVVVATGIDRTEYKVKGYDFTTGTKDYNGASYIEEVKIEKNGDVVIILKESYTLAKDRVLKGEITLVNKKDKNDTITIDVEKTLNNKVEEYVYGGRKASEAESINGLWENGNTVLIMDEDGGYVSFSNEMLKGVVKMNKEEKTFLNLIYGGQEETVEAIEELLGEEYLDEAIIEYYEFETRAFKNEVAFSYEAYEDDPHYFYLYNDGKLTAIDVTYDDDEDVEAWVWTAIAEGTIIVTDVEIVLAEEETKNPDTGANDVVGVAAALAVVSIISAAAVAIKK